ncbi:hypothetical protein ES707_09965 [subsurface metagenome]
MASEATSRSPWVTGLWIAILLAGVAFSQAPMPTRGEFQEMRRQEISARRAALERRRLTRAMQPSAAQAHYDVSHYRIELHIDPAEEQISGMVTMTARAKADNLAAVDLDLDSGMTVVSVGGSASTHSRSGNLLQVVLSQPIQKDTFFTIQVAYHGQPARYGPEEGPFAFDYHGGTPIIWSLSEPYGARAWWPCKDTPADKADSVDIIVTVPTDLIVASNGSLVSTEANGDGTRTYHWHESYPITTYLVSLAISNYAVYSEWFNYKPGDSLEVRYYVYPEAVETAQAQLTKTLDMLDYFHDIFGPYPFLSEKYGIAQFPWRGGMEHQTITSQGSFGTILTVHELAHQWWGDKITCASWHEIWLNEGFASYAEALYFEHTQGKDYYHTYMGWMDRYYPYPIYVDDITSVARIFDITVYDKGGWFLHMLRHIVGDSTFFDILRSYSNDPRFAYGNATTAGFQSVCESVSEQDLDWFFQPWIYSAGRPEYRIEWSAADSAGMFVLDLKVEQTQVPERVLFPMPIDITVETARGDTVVTVFNDQPVQYYVFALAAEPTGIVLDKDGWILKEVVSVTAVDFALFQNYPNPFNAVSHISYSVPRPSHVKLVIYDILGREIATLVNRTLETDRYTAAWRGRDQEGVPAASGVYFYRIEMRNPNDGGLNFTQARKMVLLK